MYVATGHMPACTKCFREPAANLHVMLQVELDALNDNKLIAVCIYNIVLLSVVGTVVAFTIQDDLDMMYGFLAALLNTGTMVTSCIIFLPKVGNVVGQNLSVEDAPILL